MFSLSKILPGARLSRATGIRKDLKWPFRTKPKHVPLRSLNELPVYKSHITCPKHSNKQNQTIRTRMLLQESHTSVNRFFSTANINHQANPATQPFVPSKKARRVKASDLVQPPKPVFVPNADYKLPEKESKETQPETANETLSAPGSESTSEELESKREKSPLESMEDINVPQEESIPEGALGRIVPKKVPASSVAAVKEPPKSMREILREMYPISTERPPTPPLEPEDPAIQKAIEAEERKKKKEERIKEIADKDGRFLLLRIGDKIVNIGLNYWKYAALGLILLIPSIMVPRNPRDGHEREGRVWRRHEWCNLADSETERVIYELCLYAAISALPAFNPIHSPMTNIRGDYMPVYPTDRQSASGEPPIFWKLRIDFPGPREGIWESNSDLSPPVTSASPDYNGAQFMWILSRTWENGEPVIRILMGKQVGGTTKANPKRSLIPWKMTVFRSRRLAHWITRQIEKDLMYKDYHERETAYDRGRKLLSATKYPALPRVDPILTPEEWEMLQNLGYLEIIENPDTVGEWPADNIIVIDPLDVSNFNEDGVALPDDPYGLVQDGYAESQTEEELLENIPSDMSEYLHGDPYADHPDQPNGEEFEMEEPVATETKSVRSRWF